MTVKTHEIAGFTWLKCILPIFVILVHYREIWSLSISIPSECYRPTWQDILFMNVASLAVPLFFVMSLYLYVGKRQNNLNGGLAYLGKRIVYLGILFMVWRIIYTCFGIGSLWISERGLIRNLYHWILGGGDTALYFLEILIGLMILEEVLLQAVGNFQSKVVIVTNLAIFLMACLLLASAYYLPYPANVEALRHFSPFAFLPYIPLACLLHKINDSAIKIKMKKTDIGLFVVAIGLVVYEWFILPSKVYLDNGYFCAMPSYARLSSVFLSAFIIRLSLRIPKSKLWAKMLAGLSLYVYCFHQILITVTQKVANVVIRLGIVIVCTYACSYMVVAMKKHFAKRKAGPSEKLGN